MVGADGEGVCNEVPLLISLSNHGLAEVYLGAEFFLGLGHYFLEFRICKKSILLEVGEAGYLMGLTIEPEVK